MFVPRQYGPWGKLLATTSPSSLDLSTTSQSWQPCFTSLSVGYPLDPDGITPRGSIILTNRLRVRALQADIYHCDAAFKVFYAFDSRAFLPQRYAMYLLPAFVWRGLALGGHHGAQADVIETMPPPPV